MTKEEMPACPVATTVQLIGSKWKLLIMRNLLIRPWRAMEKDGIVIRTVYPEVPPRVEYSLSELGESMRPILDSMEAWGKSYQTMVLADKTPGQNVFRPTKN